MRARAPSCTTETRAKASRPRPRSRPRRLRGSLGRAVSTSPTTAPCSANSRAAARPMPRAAPVTSTVLPSKRSVTACSLSSGCGSPTRPAAWRPWSARAGSAMALIEGSSVVLIFPDEGRQRVAAADQEEAQDHVVERDRRGDQGAADDGGGCSGSTTRRKATSGVAPRSRAASTIAQSNERSRAAEGTTKGCVTTRWPAITAGTPSRRRRPPRRGRPGRRRAAAAAASSAGPGEQERAAEPLGQARQSERRHRPGHRGEEADRDRDRKAGKGTRRRTPRRRAASVPARGEALAAGRWSAPSAEGERDDQRQRRDQEGHDQRRTFSSRPVTVGPDARPAPGRPPRRQPCRPRTG